MKPARVELLLALEAGPHFQRRLVPVLLLVLPCDDPPCFHGIWRDLGPQAFSKSTTALSTPGFDRSVMECTPYYPPMLLKAA